MGVLLCPAHLANINAWTRAQTHAMSHHQFTIKWTLNFPWALIWWCLPLESSPARCVVCSLTIQYPPFLWQASHFVHVFFLCSVSLWFILHHYLQVYYCISDVHRSRGCFYVLSALLFRFSLITSFTQSLLSLLDLWPEVTWHPAAPTETHTDRMKVLLQAAKANILFSPLLLFCPSICLPVLISHFFPLSQLSLSLSLYHIP